MNALFSEKLSRIEHAGAALLPETATDPWMAASFGTLPPGIHRDHIAPLITPCRSLVDSGGKRWRPLVLVLVAELVRETVAEKNSTALSDADTYTLTPLVEYAHTASLIHDDIEDASDMRRGLPAAHITYGIDTALNAASWLYFEAAACIDSLPIPADARAQYYAHYLTALRRLHLGQAMDIAWHRSPEQFPTRTEYTAMVQCKTGTLAALAAQTGVLAGGGDIALAETAGAIAGEIGVGFQIMDDVRNLTVGNPGKRRGDDIVEGKKSLPLLCHVAAHPADCTTIAHYFETARRDGIASPAVEQCIALLTASGAIDEAAQEGRALIAKKSAELAALTDTPEAASAQALVALFDQLSQPDGAAHA
ncbi:MAG: polyprenyl synthetase family protein [Treponema sp.]|nr:polyprenyl synthetase family protein [Treponema sp.]